MAAKIVSRSPRNIRSDACFRKKKFTLYIPVLAMLLGLG